MRPLLAKRSLQLIHEFEGDHGRFRPTPALDPTGHWEIGWGHKLPTAYYPAAPLSADQADALALADLQAAASSLYLALPAPVLDGLADNQWTALIDFAFNVGVGAVAHSTCARKLIAGDRDGAGRELAKWIWGHVDGKPQILPGLVRRRDAELDLWTQA